MPRLYTGLGVNSGDIDSGVTPVIYIFINGEIFYNYRWHGDIKGPFITLSQPTQSGFYQEQSWKSPISPTISQIHSASLHIAAFNHTKADNPLWPRSLRFWGDVNAPIPTHHQVKQVNLS